jgi:AbrB family looped-hinge helix DNA binding protein
MGESARAVKAWLTRRLESKVNVPYFQARRQRMTRLKVTAKRQITLKKDVLDRLGIKPGDHLDVSQRADGTLELRPVKKKAGRIEDFFGSLKNEHNIHLTLDEIKEEIEKAWAGEK